MNENTRTATFVGVALVLLVVAAIVGRKPSVDQEDSLVDKVLFTDLKSPSDVAGLKIVSYDDSRAKQFEVVRQAAGWALPSHSDYPADAETQVANAASSLIDLKVLRVETSLPSEHATYGVVAPDPQKAPPGTEGVGKLIEVRDKSGNSLARLIIGNEDKRTAEGGDGQELRFVRPLPHDVVYVVALPTAKFTTDFAEWIETDLLKLDAWDITEVTLKDYTFDIIPDAAARQLRPLYQQASTIKLNFSDKDSKWSLGEFLVFEEGTPKPVQLGADEELNSVKLNELKTALDELKIVDVRRKPAGLSSDLKANKDIFNNEEAMISLTESGFFPGQIVGDNAGLVSSDGEVIVRMKDGVEYSLLFGRSAGIGSKEKDDAKESAAKSKGKADEAQGSNLNRYIMVSARFNKDLIPPPQLEPVPELPPATKSDESTANAKDNAKKDDGKSENGKKAGESDEPKATAPAEDSKKKAEQKSDSDKASSTEDKSAARERESLHYVKLQADDKKTAGKSDDSKTTKGKTKTDSKAKESKSSAPTKQETKSKDDAKSPDATEVKTDDSPATDTKKAATPATDSKDAKQEADGDDAKKAAPAKSVEDLTLERKRIETENQRKQKEYDDKVKKAEDRARELNDRFADWYYVVSDATYRKIHLERGDVIKKKADATQTDAGPGATGLDAGDDAKADALNLPPLQADPFKKRGATAKDKAVDEDAADKK
jgi:hypothetical protein